MTKQNSTYLSCPQILTTDGNSKTVVLQYSGDVNSSLLNQCEIPPKIDYLLAQNMEQFVFDFSEADSVDSSTVGLISKVVKFQKSVKIVCLEDTLVYKVLDTLQLFSVIPRFGSVEESLETEK